MTSRPVTDVRNTKRPTWMQIGMRRDVVRGAAQVSLVVGIVLNLVNQGPAFWGSDRISWRQVLLNFAVPFCVSLYSAVRNERMRTSMPAE